MTRIRECREACGMSQKYVAISVGVSPPTVSMWESGVKEPTRENLIKLADLFDVSIDYLVGRDGAPAGRDSLSAEDRKLLQTFRQLNASGRSAVLATAEAMLRQPDMRKEGPTASAM